MQGGGDVRLPLVAQPLDRLELSQSPTQLPGAAGGEDLAEVRQLGAPCGRWERRWSAGAWMDMSGLRSLAPERLR